MQNLQWVTHGTEICKLVSHKMFPCSNFMPTRICMHVLKKYICVCKQSLIKVKQLDVLIMIIYINDCEFDIDKLSVLGYFFL